MMVVRGLLHVAEQHGVSRAELPIVDTEAHVSLPQLFGIIERVLERSDDSALGLHWIGRLMEHSFGPVAHMLVYAGTLREAFALLAQFEPLIYQGDSAYSLVESTHTLSVRHVAWRGPSTRTQRFLAESTLTGFLKLVRVYFANVRPVRVRCAYPAPPYAAEYARVFGTTVEFEQPNNELEFERALLDAPSPHADSDMFHAQRVIAERRLVQVAHDAPYAVRVREQLVARFPTRITMGGIAQALGLSERSLRHQLAEEGTSYREVEHAALGMLARELLQNPQRTIQETAHEMGFSDATTFHRAVKRWTGQTPSALRSGRRDVVEAVDLSQRREPGRPDQC